MEMLIGNDNSQQLDIILNEGKSLNLLDIIGKALGEKAKAKVVTRSGSLDVKEFRNGRTRE